MEGNQVTTGIVWGTCGCSVPEEQICLKGELEQNTGKLILYFFCTFRLSSRLSSLPPICSLVMLCLLLILFPKPLLSS